jgi:dTDP-4-amino-4,6-dideoxygalactose transaminase
MAARVIVRWYDIDPSTLQPDIESLDAALEGDAAGVVIVHHYGIPVDLDRVTGRWTDRSSRPFLIEDAAQASGGTWRGRPLGAHGDFGILSFGRGKGLTGGGGGALLAGSEPAAATMEGVRSELKPAVSGARGLFSSSAQWLLARPSLYRIPASLPFLQLGETVFHLPHEPRHMPASQVGVLSRTIDMLDREIEARWRHGARLAEAAGSWGIPVPSEGVAGYLRFPVLLPPQVQWAPASVLGIMSGYPVVLPNLPGNPFQAIPVPGASMLTARLLTFPVHSRLTPDDLTRLIDLLRAAPERNVPRD